MGDVNGADTPSLETLRALLALQEKDLELDRLREEAATPPPELVEIQRQVENLEERLAELLERQAELGRQYNRHSLDIQDLAAKEKQAEADQKRAQTLREQMDYENRIRQIKDRIRELLELSTPIMEAMEAVEAEIKEVEEALKGLRPKLEEAMEANAQRVKALEAVIADKVAERETMAQGIPKDLLKEYETIRRARKGIGVVKIKIAGNTHRCGGCNVVLPTHVAQRVVLGQLVRCPSCGRLIFKD